jgi:hypothetical protein
MYTQSEARKLPALTVTLPALVLPMYPVELLVHVLTWGVTFPVCTIAAGRGLGSAAASVVSMRRMVIDRIGGTF